MGKSTRNKIYFVWGFFDLSSVDVMKQVESDYNLVREAIVK